MAAARKIKSFQLDTEEIAPIEFQLGPETFTAHGDVPGAVLLDFIASTGGDSNADTAKGILNYLKSSIVDEDVERFEKTIRDPKLNIKPSKLSEVVGYLIEERASRPTKES